MPGQGEGDDALDPAAWFAYAERDLAACRTLGLDHVSPAGFLLQQAAEKALKGYLLSEGWSLRKIHDLGALLDDAAGFEEGLERFRDLLERVTLYYLEERYPGLGRYAPDPETFDDEVEQVDDLVRELRSHVGVDG